MHQRPDFIFYLCTSNYFELHIELLALLICLWCTLKHTAVSANSRTRQFRGPRGSSGASGTGSFKTPWLCWAACAVLLERALVSSAWFGCMCLCDPRWSQETTAVPCSCAQRAKDREASDAGCCLTCYGEQRRAHKGRGDLTDFLRTAFFIPLV